MTSKARSLFGSYRVSAGTVFHHLLTLALFSLVLVGAAHAQFEAIYTFPQSIGGVIYPNGAYPHSNLVEVSPGVFFTTTTQYGGGGATCPGAGGLPGCGTIVKIDTTVSPATGTVIHQFTGTDGATPMGTLTLASDGNVYGVTENGGVNASCTAQYKCGTVYRISTTGSGFLVVHNFGGTAASEDGETPDAGIIQGTDGNLYGTTLHGGDPKGYGTLFVLKPPFDATSYSVYAFPGDQSAGAFPQLPLQAANGKVYGSASAGHSLIYFFDPVVPGPPTEALTVPDFGTAGLVEVSAGTFYGVSRLGGANHIGSLFRATLTPSATTLYSFQGGTTDGAYPQAALYLASDGILYGTTVGGGDPGCSGCGSVFNLLPGTSGKISLLHFFNAVTDGGMPMAALTEGSDGLLYGTANVYGHLGAGTVFRLPKATLPQWDSQFGDVGLWDGANSVVADAAGKVYVAGSASTRLDPSGTGTLFIARFNSNGTLDHTFNGSGYVQFGPGLSTDYVGRIRLDRAGKNIYVAGYSQGALFPGIANHGGKDGWVAKFTSKGKLVWAYMFGTPQDDLVLDMALDPAGKIYLSGGTLGNLGGTLAGTQDAFVAQLTAKLNKATGKYDFTLNPAQWGTAGDTRRARRLAYCKIVGAQPQIYAVGDDDVSGNAWISRFKAGNIPAGSLKTLTIPGGSGPGFFEAHGVGADSSCNVYLGGHNISHPQPSITDEHFFLNKYDLALKGQIWEVDGPLNSGNTLPPEDFIYDLTVDSAGRVFVGGSTSSPTLFGNTNNGEFAPWYAVYDGAKKRLRSGVVQFVGGPSVITEGNGLFANPTGIYMVGSTNGNVAGHPDPAFSDAYLYAFVPLP